MDATGLGAACCRATHVDHPTAAFPQRHEDKVCEGTERGSIVMEDTIDMMRFLRMSMSSNELLLRAVPPVLVLRLPQFLQTLSLIHI